MDQELSARRVEGSRWTQVGRGRDIRRMRAAVGSPVAEGPNKEGQMRSDGSSRSRLFLEHDGGGNRFFRNAGGACVCNNAR